MTEHQIYYYEFQTRRGPVRIQPAPNGKWVVMFDGENLGTYLSAAAAADDAGGGHTFTPSCGIELDELGVPQDLGVWTKKPFMTISRLRPG